MPYKNPAVARAYRKEYRLRPKVKAKRKAKRKAAVKAYYTTAKGKYARRISSRKWYDKNKKKALDKARRWNMRHPKELHASRQAQDAKRQAKRYGALGSWTANQFLALCKKYGNVCLCCHKKRPLGPDHVVPLSRGGSNHLSNIQTLCWPCNARKHNKNTDYRQ